MAAAAPGEASHPVRERVCAARSRQLSRQGCVNSALSGAGIEARARPDAAARGFLREAGARLTLSARSHHRVLKVARTVADLEGCERVAERHVAEALIYRGVPRPSP
jgi:magnesium chelatase family protein